MNPHSHRQRIHFLVLKSQTLGLTDQERAELERLNSIRVTEVSGGVILVEPLPMNLEEWKAMLERRKGQTKGIIHG